MRDNLNCLMGGCIILTGGAKGADSMAHEIAGELGFMRKVMPADWAQYGKRAGYLRNIAMLDEGPELVIAFWDGKSKGTLHTINEAEKRGIKVEIVRNTNGTQDSA